MNKLNKYSDHLVAYRKQGGLPQGEVKNKLADIYEELWPNHKNWGAPKINRNCPSCIGDMMKSLCAYWEQSLKVHKFPVEDHREKLREVAKEVYEDVQIRNMKWGELRKYATSKGINTKGKTKAEILAELND